MDWTMPDALSACSIVRPVWSQPPPGAAGMNSLRLSIVWAAAGEPGRGSTSAAEPSRVARSTVLRSIIGVSLNHDWLIAAHLRERALCRQLVGRGGDFAKDPKPLYTVLHMSPHGHPQAVPAASAAARRADLTVIRRLLPYLWLKGPAGVRVRVVGAVLLLIVAKVITVYIPIIYKYSVDALSGTAGAVVLPLGLLLAYGGA